MSLVIPENEIDKLRKILVIQYKPFGDVLLNTAYLPALRSRCPNAEIHYLVQEPYSAILEDNPLLDELLLMEKRKKGTVSYGIQRYHLIRRIRKNRYDLIIDQARGPGASQMTFFSGARYRLGWHKTKKLSWLKGYNWVYNFRTLKNDHIYSARAKFDMLKPLGIVDDGSGTFISITDESRRKASDWFEMNSLNGRTTVAVSPVTPIRSRQWDLDRFAALADMIINRTGYEVLLLWGPGEEEKVRSISSMMEHRPLIAPPTSFNEAGAFLQRSSSYIGNNGGILHLAVAVDTPTLTIFGPGGTNPKKWTAWHLPYHLHVKNMEIERYTDGTLGIEPETAFDKFLELQRIIGSI